MEHSNNEVSTAEGQLPPASWQEYYQAAQQLFESGDEEQAQAYYEVAQQLYEESGDDIGAAADGAEQGQPVSQLPPPSVKAPSAL